MKRKRDYELKTFICRHNLCTNLHHEENQIFCSKHRQNTTRTINQLFFSEPNHKIIILEEIIVEILLYNIPFINNIHKLSISMENKDIIPRPDINLKKKDIKTIFAYLGNMFLITKRILSIFRDKINLYLPTIYLLDNGNARINNKLLVTGYCSIWDIYISDPGKFQENKQEIIEYYRNRIIAKIASEKSTMLKKKISLNLLTKTKFSELLMKPGKQNINK